jgi:hypothetical protein
MNRLKIQTQSVYLFFLYQRKAKIRFSINDLCLNILFT